jgi:hypothetical protein
VTCWPVKHVYRFDPCFGMPTSDILLTQCQNVSK